MGMKALKRLEWPDPDNPGQVRAVNPGEPCDDLPEEKVALYSQLGLIEIEGGRRRVTPPKAPVAAAAPADIDTTFLEGSVDDVEEEVSEGIWDDLLTELDEAEKAGKDRKGVHDAIRARRLELEAE